MVAIFKLPLQGWVMYPSVPVWVTISNLDDNGFKAFKSAIRCCPISFDAWPIKNIKILNFIKKEFSVHSGIYGCKPAQHPHSVLIPLWKNLKCTNIFSRELPCSQSWSQSCHVMLCNEAHCQKFQTMTIKKGQFTLSNTHSKLYNW